MVKPPLSPYSSTSGKPSSSGSDSRKSRRTTSSDSPSASATNDHGRFVLDKRLRSVLSHSLGLPLLYALHGEDPSTLRYLRRTRQDISPEEKTRLGCVLKRAVTEWRKGDIKTEPQLTKVLAEMINEEKSLSFNALDQIYVKSEEANKPDGYIDIILTSAKTKRDQEESTPLAVIEFGLSADDWWKKLDQNAMCLDRMRHLSQPTKIIRFQKPLLFAVVTIDYESMDNVVIKLGVFLCSRRNVQDETDEYRMTLLWHSKMTTLEEGSEMFGRLLQVTSDFQSWRDDRDKHQLEYFSSNCCKIGDSVSTPISILFVLWYLCRDFILSLTTCVFDPRLQVLRSYDSRFRPTNRSAEIYLDPNCRNIVGDTDIIVKLPEQDANAKSKEGDYVVAPGSSSWDDSFWTTSEERIVQVIAMSYRPGVHEAKKPRAFLPIIAQLEELHSKGYVHGDIRGFNTVFTEQGDKGWLIDFDFGGKSGERCYPKGYRETLPDGQRLAGDNDESKILQWHDWYALGRLIFLIHEIMEPPVGENDDILKINEVALILMDTDRLWKKINREPTQEEIAGLKELLSRLDDQGWTMEANRQFKKELAKDDNSRGATKQGATGSPLEKQR